MKYEELIDFTQKILEANYLPVYRFELPCEDLDHLVPVQGLQGGDDGQPAHQLGRAPLRLDLLDGHGCSFRMLPPGRFAPF